MTRVLGIQRSTNSKKHLGLPNMVGRGRKPPFQFIKDKFKVRLDNWSNKVLSQGGKEIFVKLVSNAIPSYAMSCFLMPKSFYWELESIFTRYWWQKGKGRKGTHLFSWSNLCHLKELGGLCYHDMCKFNSALLAKQGWRIISNPKSLLVRVLKSKCFP